MVCLWFPTDLEPPKLYLHVFSHASALYLHGFQWIHRILRGAPAGNAVGVPRRGCTLGARVAFPCALNEATCLSALSALNLWTATVRAEMKLRAQTARQKTQPPERK